MSLWDRWWLWVARLALRRMSDRAAWWLWSAMRAGYIAEPGLTLHGHDDAPPAAGRVTRLPKAPRG